MTPIRIEFSFKAGDRDFKEESVALRNPEELFEYVAPGGGCESMPNDVDEIQMVFLPPEHPNTRNPIADTHVTLQMGMVFMNGPLSEVVQAAEAIMDKAGRGELAQGFITVMGGRA